MFQFFVQYQRERCGTDPVIAKVTEFFYFANVQENDEQKLKAVLIKYGPVAVFLRTHLLMDTPENPHNFFSLHERDNLECDASEKCSHVMLLVGECRCASFFVLFYFFYQQILYTFDTTAHKHRMG